MLIHEQILKPMMYQIAILENTVQRPIEPDKAFDYVKMHALAVGEIKEAETLDEAFLFIMSGEVGIIIEGFDKILIASARGWPQRGIQEPRQKLLFVVQGKDLPKRYGQIPLYSDERYGIQIL